MSGKCYKTSVNNNKKQGKGKIDNWNSRTEHHNIKKKHLIEQCNDLKCTVKNQAVWL